jgi:hypothetical protein
MASRKPYECFKCRDNGFPETMVYLAGKDDQGKTVYIEEDGTGHVHKTQTQTKSSSNGSTTVVSESTQLKIINAKLDRVISLLEEEKQRQQQKGTSQ